MHRPRVALLLLAVGTGCGLEKLNAGGGGTEVTFAPASGSIDFGEVSPYGSAVQREVAVQASGGSVVEIDDVTIEGGDGAFRLDVDPTPVTLQPGDSASIVYGFLPGTAGEFSATSNIVVRVTGEVTRRVALSGLGCPDRNHDGACEQARPRPADTGDTGAEP